MSYVYWIHLPEHTNMTSEGYIGFTSKTVDERFDAHKRCAGSRRKKHYPISVAIKTYGKKLIIDTLVEGSPEYCLIIEKTLRKQPNIGWNIRSGGETNWKDVLHNSEVRKRISNLITGRKHSLETLKYFSESRKGVLNANYGNKLTDESRKKISESKIGKGLLWNNPRARKEVWLVACALFDVWNTQNFGESKLQKHFNISYRLETILKAFKSGWNPYKDLSYLIWLQSIKEENGSSLVN